MEELYRIAGSKAAQGKVILVHLGSRKSLAAFKNGWSVEEGVDFTTTGDLTSVHQNSPANYICYHQCGRQQDGLSVVTEKRKILFHSR